MSRREGPRAGLRRWAGLAIVAALIGGGAVALGGRSGPASLPERAAAERPKLLLLTSLPLIFPEKFGLEAAGSPALTALERRYAVEAINVADAATLAGNRLLLMAHPLAQPAEALVALDAWVRGGGRLVLLADPKLDWPSERPLGDKLRPPPAFADTGLLAHWGLQLESRERRAVRLGGGHHPILFISPGELTSKNKDCALTRAGIIAECQIGNGYVAVIADADFLNPELTESQGAIPANQTGELLEILESIDRR